MSTHPVVAYRPTIKVIIGILVMVSALVLGLVGKLEIPPAALFMALGFAVTL